MKIAHLTWSLGTGGIETMLIDITNEQIISNQVAIYVINDNLDRDIVNRINKKCIFICCSRKIGSKNILPILRLNYELYKFNPDIIHIHLPGIIKLIPFIRSKKVFTIHNTHTDNKEYSKFDSLFAISDAVKMHTLQQGYNAITIYNGIDTNAVSYNKELKDTSVFKIIQIGRLYTPHKGQHILLKAINLLVHNRGFYNISVDFIGEGPSFEELYEYVVSHKLQDFVSFIGLKSREYIYRNLCEYDLCVQPSLSEGFGLTIVESMLAKVPVLVSNLEGPMEVICHGKLGNNFIVGDYVDLANQIEFQMKKGTNTKQIKEAYEYAKFHYDVKNTANKYLDEYKKVLDR